MVTKRKSKFLEEAVNVHNYTLMFYLAISSTSLPTQDANAL